MKKQKIYLDTSVISHLAADDVPDKMDDTLELWNILKRNQYEVVISEITFNELSKCNVDKSNIFAGYIALIDYIFVEDTVEIEELATEYLKHDVLTNKSYDDLTHIACAVLNDCDYIVSWNFKHFVNIKTISKVNSVNMLLGYEAVRIIPPPMLIGGNEDE